MPSGSQLQTSGAPIDKSLVGHVAYCSKGKLGLILDRKYLPWGLSWVGICLQDRRPWASREPRLIWNGSCFAHVQMTPEQIQQWEAAVWIETEAAEPAPVGRTYSVLAGPGISTVN